MSRSTTLLCNQVYLKQVMKLLRWRIFRVPGFFQENQGNFIRKHCHTTQGNDAPAALGTAGFHGQGLAGHCPAELSAGTGTRPLQKHGLWRHPNLYCHNAKWQHQALVESSWHPTFHGDARKRKTLFFNRIY